MYLAAGKIPAAFLCRKKIMLELVGCIFMGLIAIILSEWLFGGILNTTGWIGYRAYSIFTGEWDVPVIELRKKHQDSIWPWVIVFTLFGTILYLIIGT